MLKSIKVSEKNYEEIKNLSKELEKKHVIPYVEKVNINSTISFALNKAKENLEMLEKRKKFLSAAGGWKDIDENLVKEIYEGRKKGTRWGISLD
ncbi:MAG: hypothetical protein IH934_00590 [Nanoarchaeota archaeon]|nr:hypothetical protein [Nanoarchaeota archaeon]